MMRELSFVFEALWCQIKESKLLTQTFPVDLPMALEIGLTSGITSIRTVSTRDMLRSIRGSPRAAYPSVPIANLHALSMSSWKRWSL